MSPEEQVTLRRYLGEKIDDVAGDVRDLANDFAEFKQHVYTRFDPLERDLEQRVGGSRAYARVWTLVVGGSAVVGVMAGVVIALARLIIPSG